MTLPNIPDPPYRAMQDGGARLDAPWFVVAGAIRENPDRIDCGHGIHGHQRADLMARRLNEEWSAGYQACQLADIGDKLRQRAPPERA